MKIKIAVMDSHSASFSGQPIHGLTESLATAVGADPSSGTDAGSGADTGVGGGVGAGAVARICAARLARLRLLIVHHRDFCPMAGGWRA